MSRIHANGTKRTQSDRPLVYTHTHQSHFSFHRSKQETQNRPLVSFLLFWIGLLRAYFSFFPICIKSLSVFWRAYLERCGRLCFPGRAFFEKKTLFPITWSSFYNFSINNLFRSKETKDQIRAPTLHIYTLGQKKWLYHSKKSFIWNK